VLAFSLAVAACSGSAPPELAHFGTDGGGSGMDGSMPPMGEDATLPSDDGHDDALDGRDAAHDVGRADGDAATGLDARHDGGGGGQDGDAASEGDAGRTVLCVRLFDPMRPNSANMLSEQVLNDYVGRLYQDCNVSKLVKAQLDTFFNFQNDMILYQLDLWGCSQQPASGFGITRPEFPGLTSADVARLIDDYMESATKVLKLSAMEAAQMRGDLTGFGAAAITRQSDEFSLSTCVPEGGADATDANVDGAVEGGPPEQDIEAGDETGGPG
jgi:hypothetical protein